MKSADTIRSCPKCGSGFLVWGKPFRSTTPRLIVLLGKVNDIQSGSRLPKQCYSSGVDMADMIRVTGAVSAKMAAERGIKRVPLAVLSQSEVTRRMKAI